MKKIKKHIYQKYAVIIVSIAMCGNVLGGNVLCLSSNGHAEIESAFHRHCEGHIYSHPEVENLSLQSSHDHCKPCIDIPVHLDLIKTNRISRQLSSVSSESIINTDTIVGNFNSHAYNSVSSNFDTASNLTSLSTIVLLI